MYDNNYYDVILYYFRSFIYRIILSVITVEIPTHVSLIQEGINIKKHLKCERMKSAFTYNKKGEKINIPATLQRVPYYS